MKDNSGDSSEPLKRMVRRLVAFSVRSRGRIELPPERVLVIACDWIGDNFWASQVLPTLSAAWPEAELWVATKAHSTALFHGLMSPERLLTLPEVVSDRRRERASPVALWRRARSLRGHRFGLVIDLTGNRYSALFTRWVGARGSVGFGGDELGAVYTLCVEDAERSTDHLAERPWRVIQALVPEAERPELPRPVSSPMSFEAAAVEIGLNVARPFALLGPGAGWGTKRWPVEGFRELAGMWAERGTQVVACGSNGERELCERVVEGIGGGFVCTVPLAVVCALLPQAQTVVTNDSALAHLAAAAGVRTVAVFCPTNPARCGPRGAQATTIRPACPLAPTGRTHHCPHWVDEPRCPRSEWMTLTAGEVFQALRTCT